VGIPRPLTHFGECVAECPKNYFSFEGTGPCLTVCPLSYYGYSADHTCVDQTTCNDKNMFIYGQNCITDCTQTTDPEKTYNHNGVCLSICPEQWYAHSQETLCKNTCPADQFKNDVEQICMNKNSCNNLGRFIYKENCIKDCTLTYDPPLIYYLDGECIEQCPPKYFTHEGKGECRSEGTCPDNYFADASTHTCIDKTLCNYNNKYVYVSAVRKECIDDCAETS
ncbi:MAG: hypothetical protein QF704_11655, partial [Anaerolineales bacterium]|nr:hypothetical protein [Anaerolineales bacterium]